jgi:hypothetical protein
MRNMTGISAKVLSVRSFANKSGQLGDRAELAVLMADGLSVFVLTVIIVTCAGVDVAQGGDPVRRCKVAEVGVESQVYFKVT